jgi:cellulose-binding protein
MVTGDKFDYFGESGKTAEELQKQGYIVWTPPHPKGEFLGEGDTGTFLSLLENGLEGWRQENRRNPSIYQTAGATNIVPFGGGVPAAGAAGAAARGRGAGPRQPSRFLRPLMHDLAERMTWAVTPKYADANHYPTVTLRNSALSGKPGEVVKLSAITRDPDGDKVSLKWWRFEGNGSYIGTVALDTTEGLTTSIRIPADAKPGDTIHIIAEANDDATLTLTRYARAVVTVK